MISKNKQRKLGVVLQYAQMAFGILISVAYTPIMLRMLGQTEYGIYNLASSTIAYLSLLSLGFGSSYIRFYSIYRKDSNNDAIKRMNGLYIFVFSIMGLIALIGGLILSSNVSIFFNDTYTENEIHIAKILMLILTFNLAISFPMSIFTSYIASQEEFIFQKVINLCVTVISPISNIILLFLGYGSISLVVTTSLITLLHNIISAYYCFRKIGMEVSFKNMDFSLLKDIFLFSFFIALNQIIDQINWQTDKIVLGKMVNGSSVAVYAIGSQIDMMYINFSAAIASVFTPKINMIVSKHEPDMDKELTSLFTRVGRIQWFLLGLILSGFIFFGKYFIYRWAGEEYSNSYWVAILLMVPVTIPLIQSIGLEVQRAKNKHQFMSVVYLIMAICNVGISIWLVFMWKEIGAALGTAVSLIFANGLVMNIYYQKRIGIDIISYWKSFFSTLPGFIVPIICGICLVLFYNFHSLIDFVLLIVAYTIIYIISIYFLSFNEEEKSGVNAIIKKLLRKNKNQG